MLINFLFIQFCTFCMEPTCEPSVSLSCDRQTSLGTRVVSQPLGHVKMTHFLWSKFIFCIFIPHLKTSLRHRTYIGNGTVKWHLKTTAYDRRLGWIAISEVLNNETVSMKYMLIYTWTLGIHSYIYHVHNFWKQSNLPVVKIHMLSWLKRALKWITINKYS